MNEQLKTTTYSRWEDVPANLKTKTAIKALGLKLKRGQQPVAVKTSSYYKTPDYSLYEVSEAVPNVVSDKQRAAVAKAQEESLKKRTCTKCGWVEDLSKNYRNKLYISGGLCPYCREEADRASDRNEAIEWAQNILKRDDVLILDSETTDLYGEIIELAMINLKGETVYNRRFNPIEPISKGAQAVHGISAEMVANEPRFAECAADVLPLLAKAGLVLIYNAAFDTARLSQTCKLHGLSVPSYKADCIMEQYAAFCGEWSDYHGNYKYQPLGGGDHSALGDCKAALATLHEMAGEANHIAGAGEMVEEGEMV
jgi:DNA polymerase-3 subunit epsilon